MGIIGISDGVLSREWPPTVFLRKLKRINGMKVVRNQMNMAMSSFIVEDQVNAVTFKSQYSLFVNPTSRKIENVVQKISRRNYEPEDVKLQQRGSSLPLYTLCRWKDSMVGLCNTISQIVSRAVGNKKAYI